MSGLREKKKANTRESLLNAAAQLFAERGFSETTVDQIAEKAEVSKVTFYGYFKAKEDLLTALHNRVLEHALELVNEPQERKLGSVHRLNRLIEAMGKWTEDNVELFKVLLTEKTLSFNYCSQKSAETECPMVQSIVDIIQTGVDSGEFKSSTDAEKTARYLALLCFSEKLGWLQSQAQDSLVARLKGCLAILVNGISA